MTYRDSNYKYEKEYKIIWDKYISKSGVYLTANNFVNKAIIAFLRISNKYYSFYLEELSKSIKW